MSDYNINALAIPIFLVLMAFEYLGLKLTGRNLHRYNDTVTSMSMGLCLLISDALLKAYTFAVYIWLWQEYRFFEFTSGQALTWIVFFFGVDFCYYWFHRVAHERNVLWGAHVGHHQGEEFNLTTAVRQSAFQYAFSWIFYLPLALLGCPPEVFLVQFIILKAYQFWIHTQLINKIPFLEGIFSTPSSHRVHHAKNPIYVDKNYGGTLVIWDRLFGTWQPEISDQPCHYGTTKPLDSLSPIKLNLQHWNMLFNDMRTTTQWRDKLGLWLKPTGWRPSDCVQVEGQDVLLQRTGSADHMKYDPKTSRPKRVYAGMSMVLTFIAGIMFIFLNPQLTTGVKLFGAMLLISGVIIATALLENKPKVIIAEAIRLPAILWLIAHLWSFPVTTTIVDHIVIEQSAENSLNYASSVKRWPEWHPQSKHIYLDHRNPLTQGESFEEDIDTPIGENRLAWKVLESTVGKVWIAEAHNLTNGSYVVLEYRAKNVSHEQSEFERTLHYTLPNFALVVANALHFKKVFERKSEDALLRLKTAVEAL